MAIESVEKHLAFMKEPHRSNWYTRYQYYCQAHGFNDPEAMLERDKAVWTGDETTGFSTWCREAWWMAVVDLCEPDHCLSPDDFIANHKDAVELFHDWLAKHHMEVPKESEETEDDD